MLQPTTLEKLRSFRLAGFVDALIAQSQSPHYTELTFEERLSLLIEAEHTRRLDAKTKRLIKAARLPGTAALSEVDFAIPRGLNKPLFLELCQGNWVRQGTNIILTGPTGTGKTFLASVLAHTLCTSGTTVRFQRTHQWLSELQRVQEQNRLSQTIAKHRRAGAIVFDEWMRDPIPAPQARLLLDLLDDRYDRLSCVFAAQVPIDVWHSRFDDPTLADAILDRIVHHSIRIDLQGESVRKSKHRQGKRGDASLRSDNLD